MKVYLKENNVKNCVLYFVGERFNLLFHNGGAVFYVAEHILEFIDKIWGKPNRLLVAIETDLRKKELLLACRALGLLDRQITAPWLEYTMAERPVLVLSDFYTKSVEQIRKWSIDASELLSGNNSIYELPINKDPVWDKLVKPSDSDEAILKCLLQKLCLAIVVVCERQLSDQLPGGKFHSPSDIVQKTAASCTANNISGERVFATLDAAIKRAPNASCHFLESKLLFQHNSTADWLNELADSEKQNIMSVARRTARLDCQVAKDEKLKIHQETIALLHEKREKLSNKDETQRVVKENLLEDLCSNGGLWESGDAMEQNLLKLKSDRKKLLAVKNQIKVRKVLLQQKADAKLFAFSQGKKTYSLQALKINLESLMLKPVTEQSCINIANIMKEPNILVDKYLSHKWADSSKLDTWYEGKCIEFSTETDEFGIQYLNEENNSVTYLTLSEVIADIRTGDLVILW
jgi:hypothetical protein